MNSPGVLPARLLRVFVPAGVGLMAWMALGQSAPHLTVTWPGGMPGLPVMTGIERMSNGVSITWDGPPGYYQVLQKPALADGQWQAWGGRTNLSRKATITVLQSNAFFRVAGPPPQYVGARACAECHGAIHRAAAETRHTGALEALQRIGQENNPACLPCHTVGYGLPTGFTNTSLTPHLAGVQCENCHGPAANHAANEFDLAVRPRLEIASTVCGGCHTGAHQPTFDEWHGSGHAALAEDMNPENRIDSCGRCHSGSVRLSLLKNDPLPAGDANLPIGCVTCHDPHGNRVYTNVLTGMVVTNQLRNPVTSTNDFAMASAAFTNRYDPSVNLCGQCHNHRGVSWSSSARAPHHSPQYNMLLGAAGELNPGVPTNQPGAHAFLDGQCVTCHMQREEYRSDLEPAVTGHDFRVAAYNACLGCHPFMPELFVAFTQGVISNRIQRIKSALDTWATTKAPLQLRTNYGAWSWEYTEPGDLSPGGSGPSEADQALVPDRIRKARFNVYLVLYDGSCGVHNGRHSGQLLETAAQWVEDELNE